MAEAMEVQLSKNDCSADITSAITDRAAHPPDPPPCSDHTHWMQSVQHDHDYFKTTGRKDVRDEIGFLLLKNDSIALRFTGIALKVFDILVSTLEGYACDAFKISVRDQVLLTLMKLKTNRTISDLGELFCVPQITAEEIILYWIDKLEVVLRPLIPWLPKETIQATMPQAFKQNFPNTTCVIHCGKSFLERKRNLDSEVDSCPCYYDSKYIVAVAPCGLIMFISRAYVGRNRDKYITMSSGILDLLKPGDEVMADQGSSLSDLLLEEKGIKLVIPSITAEEQLASTRQVERAIRHFKVYKILSQVISNTMAPKINKILIICCALVNLREEVICNSHK